MSVLTGVDGHLEAQTVPSGGNFVPGELIVRLKAGEDPARLDALLTNIGAVDAKGFETVDGLYVVKLRGAMSVRAAAELARRLDAVAYAEPNYIVTTQATPNDPSYGDLWGLHNIGQSGGTVGADIRAPEAWDITTGSSNVVVVVVDTGIDYTHPDLVANMFRNEADCNTNGVDDDGNGSIDDCHGIDTINHDSNPLDDHVHGTHVAGTIGASGNNGVGVVGVNWNVKLMACKFLGSNGSGSTADAVTCLDYVANMKDRGVNIVATNNSWGGGGFSQALYDAINAQRQRGILFIAAAGNGGSDQIGDDNDSTPTYPANYDLPNVIAVASTTRTDAQSTFSNFGRRTVHVGAPGSAILSTTPNNSYSTLNGTSMATPHVTGVAALLKAQDPTRDWRAIRNLILAGGANNANLSNSTITGKRLNAHGSLTCSNSAVFSRLKPDPSAVVTTVGTAVGLSALNITCAAGSGNVTVSVSPGGQLVTLLDDGAGSDQAAGDGTYTGSFLPVSTGVYTLTFPNSETLTVHVLAATAYSVWPAGFAFRQITGTSLSLGDDTSAQVSAPFPILFGGGSFDSVFVNSNGNLTLAAGFTEYANVSLPITILGGPRPLIAPFWDDLLPVGSTQNVFWAVTGSAPNRELVVEWRNVTGFQLISGACASSENVTFQLVLFEGRSSILFNYSDTAFGGSCGFRDRGASATVGIQTSPAVSRQYSVNSASVNDGVALLWTLGGTAGPFSDSPLSAGVTPIRVVHITELRARIDALRAQYGLSAFSWTDPTISSSTIVRAVHLSELRTALQGAYTAGGLVAPPFTDSSVVAGSTLIKAVHIQELRDGVMALEAR